MREANRIRVAMLDPAFFDVAVGPRDLSGRPDDAANQLTITAAEVTSSA